jgi:hypothetical protein
MIVSGSVGQRWLTPDRSTRSARPVPIGESGYT